MRKMIPVLALLVPAAALALASSPPGQARAKETPVPAPAKPVDLKSDPLAAWLAGFFGWGPGDITIEEVAQVKVPGYRFLRVVKNYKTEPKNADQLFAAVEIGGTGVLVGDALGDEERRKSPAPVRSDADLNGMRELLKTSALGAPRLSLAPSLDRKGWKGVNIRQDTGYGNYPVTAYISAQDGAVLMIGRFWDRSRSLPEQRRELIKLADTPAVGPPDARVTVVEYSDMECPSCKKRTIDWDALQAKLAPELKIRRYVKNFPLTASHPWAFRAASAGRCFFERSPELYFRYKSSIYNRQEELNVAAVDAFSLAFAVDNGIPDASFRGCYLHQGTDEKILSDLAEGMAVRVRSTPSYFIDGVAVIWFADPLMEDFLRTTYLGGRDSSPPAQKSPAR